MTMKMTYNKCWMKTVVNQKFQWNYPSNIKYKLKLNKFKGWLKIFPDKQELRELITNRSFLQGILTGILQSEMKGHKRVIWIHRKK